MPWLKESKVEGWVALALGSVCLRDEGDIEAAGGGELDAISFFDFHGNGKGAVFLCFEFKWSS